MSLRDVAVEKQLYEFFHSNCQFSILNRQLLKAKLSFAAHAANPHYAIIEEKRRKEFFLPNSQFSTFNSQFICMKGMMEKLTLFK